MSGKKGRYKRDFSPILNLWIANIWDKATSCSGFNEWSFFLFSSDELYEINSNLNERLKQSGIGGHLSGEMVYPTPKTSERERAKISASLEI